MTELILAATLLLGDPVDDLIDRLSSDDPFEREAATDALKRAGKAVEPRLRALRTDDPEVAWRRDAILEHLRALRIGKVLTSLVILDPEGVCVEHANAETAAEVLGLHGVQMDGKAEDAGFRGRLLFFGAESRRPRLFPWNRIVQIGWMRGGPLFACFQRNTSWRDRDPAALLPALREEIRRPFEIGPSDAFQLLQRAPLFPQLAPALEERMKTTDDPVVREACRLALERQRRTP